MPGSINIETPNNIDAIFSLDGFRYNDLKGILKDIFAHLTKLGLKVNELDDKFATIPDFTKLTKQVNDLSKRADENDKYNKNFKEKYE
jgi:hypothetical protein